jgi:hypothetical protein
MLILNYAHPLTPEMLGQIAVLLVTEAENLQEMRLTNQIDRSKPIAEEVIRLADAAGLSADEWQTKSFLLNPPGLSLSALALVAELHGRCGYFPTVLAVSPVLESTPPQFMVTGLVNLQSVRDEARQRR